MSLTNPVISDLIVTTYEQARYAEVEKVLVRRTSAPRAARFTWHAMARGVRGIGVAGAMVLAHAGRRFRSEVAVPAGSGGDGSLC
jgi:hypothetical protein